MSDFIIKAVELIEQGYLDAHTTQELAQELFVSECHLRRQFKTELGISPVKAAMNMMGKNVGPLRLPLTEIEPAHAEKLEKALKAYGLL